MNNVYFFKDQKECENFFTKIAENNNEVLSDDFIFEGNSATTYEFIREIGSAIGYNNIGIENNSRTDMDFIDTIFINIKNISFNKINSRIWLDADEISIEPEGYIRIWWD